MHAPTGAGSTPRRRPMNTRFYHLCRGACRFIRGQCVRHVVLGLEGVPADGPVLFAVTHLSHIEPAVVSSFVERPIYWMARAEFYRTRVGTAVLNRLGAFPVNRSGWPRPAIRSAMTLVNRGEAVGVFPEGGVARGPDSVLMGGPIKQGICLVSLRTGTPILPVVVLGTPAMGRIGPWLPRKRGRLWVAFGRPIHPGQGRHSSRRLRSELALRVQEGFSTCYTGLLSAASLQPGVHE